MGRLRKDGDKNKEKDTELVASQGDRGRPEEDAAPEGPGGEDEPAEEKADRHSESKEQSKAQPRGKRSDTALSGMEAGGAADTDPSPDKGSPVVIAAPLSVLEPHRTDPMHSLRQRHKKMERAVASNLPELHLSGQLVSGRGIIQDSTEGCCCRYVRMMLDCRDGD